MAMVNERLAAQFSDPPSLVGRQIRLAQTSFVAPSEALRD
jgi:hypothetical protein